MRRWVDGPDQNKTTSSDVEWSGVEWSGVVGCGGGGWGRNVGSSGPDREGGGMGLAPSRDARRSFRRRQEEEHTQTHIQTHTRINSQDGELARKGSQARKEEKADGEADQCTDVTSGKEEDAVPPAHCRVRKGKTSADPYAESTSTEACLSSVVSGLP